jgi:hypothetical protein
MRGKLTILVILAVTAIFFNFYNAGSVVKLTREKGYLEKGCAAEKNIHTELMVELDDLRSGKNISSLVSVELSGFVPDKQQAQIIYVHEPGKAQQQKSYCIVDLISSRAEAKDIQIIPD